MEILQTLLSYLLKNPNLQNFSPIIESLKQNNFDFKKVLSNLNLENIMPMFNSIMQTFGQNKNPSPSFYEEEGLNPINDFADKQIIDSLNCYFSREI